MAISKQTKSLNMPWEQEYGYSQAVKVGDTIYLSGQVSHDDKGNIVGLGDMEMQMRQAYANVQKVLAQYGATMANIVDEVRIMALPLRCDAQRDRREQRPSRFRVRLAYPGAQTALSRKALCQGARAAKF